MFLMFIEENSNMVVSGSLKLPVRELFLLDESRFWGVFLVSNSFLSVWLLLVKLLSFVVIDHVCPVLTVGSWSVWWFLLWNSTFSSIRKVEFKSLILRASVWEWQQCLILSCVVWMLCLVFPTHDYKPTNQNMNTRAVCSLGKKLKKEKRNNI